MSDLRERLLNACTVQQEGVTDVTHVTSRGVKENAGRYARYARYVPIAHHLRDDQLFRGKQYDPDPDKQKWDASEWQAYFDERAAIREFEANTPRSDAERLAWEDSIVQWLYMDPTPASDVRDGCISCGFGDRPGDPLLPVLAPSGHTWVHNLCWKSWQDRRRRAATEALATLIGDGIASGGGTDE